MSSKGRKESESPPHTLPAVPPEKGIELLRRQQEEARQMLANPPISDMSYRSWKNVTKDYLNRAFGLPSNHVGAVMNAPRVQFYEPGTLEPEMERDRADGLECMISAIDGVIKVLETDIELGNQRVREPGIKSVGGKIFLVHGHDREALFETERFLRKLDLDVVILHERPNKGRTIIEKFEEYSSDVGFAVVLLTPDDRGGPVDMPEKHQLRARQNVILELGFFLGKIGRDRVCPLYREGVEIPSDYSGVVFVLMDKGGQWKTDLAKEIKAAGFDIHMNKVLE